MLPELGHVSSIDYDAGVVRGQLDEGGEFEAPWSGLHPPPPLAPVLLVRERQRHVCLGAPGARLRELFHEDFLNVDPAIGYGDTFWQTGGTVGTINTGTGLDAEGHIRIRGNPTNGQEVWLKKTNQNLAMPSDLDMALHFACRFLIQQTTLVRYRLGLADDAAANDPSSNSGSGVYLSASTASQPEFELRANTGATQAATDFPTAFAASTWYHLNLVVQGDEWAAAWLDGDGPYIIEGASVPGPADTSMTPILYVEALENVAKLLFVDWCRMELFEPREHPSRGVAQIASGEGAGI